MPPAELQPLRELWVRQDLDALERELEQTKDAYGDDPRGKGFAQQSLEGLLAS